MSEIPLTLLEREVNAIVRGGFPGEPMAAMANCVCGHSAVHHDGFGCAEVENPYEGRCGCENYVAQTPRDQPGSITSGDPE